MSLADKYFPEDARVLYEARTLIEAGHEVFLLCQNKPDGLSEEIVEGIKVLRVTMPQNYLWFVWNISCYGVYNPRWKKSLARIVKQENIEALHIHDLPRVIMGLSVARRFNIPLVADLHENYSSAVSVWRKSDSHRSHRLILAIISPPFLWKQIEGFSIRRADRVITIVDEAREYYIATYGVSLNKFVILMNAPDLANFYSFPIDVEIVEKYEQYFTITYIGNFGPHRDIKTAILAMPEILQAIHNAKLVLVGSGSTELALKSLVNDMQLNQAVEFTGQQPFDKIPSYITASNVCLHTYVKSTALQSTASSPHKVFQYMAMSKPSIIASSQESADRLVSNAKAGLIYSAENPHSLALAVIQLYQNSDLANKMGEAGKKAVIDKYNWDEEGKKLVDLYEQLRR